MVSCYNDEFAQLAREVTGASEVDLIQDYIDGLPPGVKFETDHTELQTLDDAMAKALDMELWLSMDSSRRGFSRGARGYKGAVIPVDSFFRGDPHDLTGPAPMELCAFQANRNSIMGGMPPCHPAIPLVVWIERWREKRCLLYGRKGKTSDSKGYRLSRDETGDGTTACAAE
uniref:Uncharacterized protein n=1 Tax=Chromera velia CCMP2878 TaxID=1169474 RepID=A0A0G4HJ04_9ALVE|eukprot:Cvel_27980.t1-p1 / transcript=Cvel_27980.t1 / gene=Cvel_27980 / organism=Chromera_velia_CCMP2878 / gene_product=hypothetical protein / transcript_product=hypothetical protein / location=Cvel_scaffold3580:1071-2458(+) / protein_length=171 / sequence_SO=supercontig / SO=protein_coding / is_pseudo=false